MVRNAGPAPISGWTLSWTFPSGQRISQVWGGTHTQTGATVSLRDAGYNGALAPGATATAGFLAGTSGANDPPTTITCTTR